MCKRAALSIITQESGGVGDIGAARRGVEDRKGDREWTMESTRDSLVVHSKSQAQGQFLGSAKEYGSTKELFSELDQT